MISDYLLGNMNGLAMARAIKQRCRFQSIILITAYAESMAMQKDMLTDIDYMLSKPFALNQLQEALTAVFSPAA